MYHTLLFIIGVFVLIGGLFSVASSSVGIYHYNVIEGSSVYSSNKIFLIVNIFIGLLLMVASLYIIYTGKNG
jgi:hypothetical protein